jgi:hypothetical protein
MADVITRFKLETTQYDSKLRDASKGLVEYTRMAAMAGNEFDKFTQKNVDAARALGTIAPSATNAKDKVKELVGAFNDTAKAYNALTKEQQQSDFGKAMAGSLEQLSQKIREAKNEMYGLGNAAGKVKSGGLFSGMGDKMTGALQVFAGNMMTKAAGAVANLGAEMYDMVQQGIEMAKQGEGIRIAFERLGRGDILQGLREATHGTVTDLELMKAAVKFNDFKLPVEELGTMLAFAQQKAKDTGQSVDYMVDSIVTGLGRKSLMILDNLGLSATEIRERMKETGDMTKAVGEIIREQMAKAGDYMETAADRAAQANTDLQNKMEALGRKFAPVEEASNQLWTSMKIGILDIVGGPLATMLNQLTEAGRLKNALNDMNGDPSTEKPTKVQQQLSALRGSNYKNVKYRSQLSQYDKQIGTYQTMIANGGKMPGAPAGSGKDVRWLQTQLEALKTMRSEYVAGAKDIMKPVEVTVKTDKAEQNVSTLNKQLKELEKQRKEAVKKGDQEQVETITKQISQTKTNLGYLSPASVRTRTAATPKTEEQQNQTRIAELVKQYQDLATAVKTADDAQKAGLTERMAKIQGEIKTLQDRNTELKKFADEAKQVQYPVGSLPQLNEQLKTLQTEQAKALDAKQWQDYQRQIEQAQYQIDALKGKWHDGLQATFKLNIEQQGSTDISTAKPDDIAVTFKADDADVLAKVRDIEGITIDPKTLTVTANTVEAYNQVQQLLENVDGKTVTFAVQPKMETGTSITNDAGIQAYIASIKQQLETADYGTSLYNGLSAQLADMTTLRNLVGESLKAGLGTAMFDAADETGRDFWTRAMEGGVENTDWQAIVDKINEKLKAAGLDAIKLDFTTGAVSNDDKDDKNENPYLHKNKDGKEEVKLNEVLSGVAHGMQGMVSGMEQLGIDIPSGIQDVLKGVDGVTQILTSIMSVITAIEAISAADAFVPFAHGGVVRAAAGWSGVVPGNSMSGDNVPALLNSGEVVLNHAQVSAVANELQSKDGGTGQRDSFITGEQIHIVHNRYLRRVGEGEIVTWKNT